MIHLKSHREIELMRASADLVGRTLAEVGRCIVPGVSTRELDRVAETFIRDHGGEPAFKGYRIGSNTFPASLCISVNDVVVHGIPGGDRLQEGDLVSVDCGVRLNGYYGDSAFTFAVVDVSDEKRRLCKVTYDALYDGIARAVAGNRVGDISHAVEQRCRPHGYGIVRDLVGHGIGRSLHEDPQVPNFGQQGKGKKLKNGLVICIEPMINMGDHEVVTDGDGWTVRTVDGTASAHYEHMVLVHDGSPEILSTFEYIEAVAEPPYADVSLTEEITHG